VRSHGFAVRLFLRSLRSSAFARPTARQVLRLFLSSLGAFASLADEAKGGDGAKSALREIFLRVAIIALNPIFAVLDGKARSCSTYQPGSRLETA
jgi:hypothetical protein